MKTPRAQGTGHDVGKAEDAAQARRKRTLTAIACESLEGKKLMTGFAGAAAMAGGMAGSPAEVGDPGGIQLRRGGPDRFDGSQDQGTAASDGPGGVGRVAPPTPATMQDGGMRSFVRRADDQGPSGSFDGDHHERAGDMGPGQDFGGRGRFDGGAGTARGTAAAPQAPTSGNAQLDADFKKLRADEQAIQDKSEVTPALQAAVRKDLGAIDAAKTGTADATKLQALRADQKATFDAEARPTDDQLAKLQADQDAVWLSQGVSQSLIDQLAADRLAVKTASHFTADDQATLDADHAAIKADMTATLLTPAAATPAIPMDASTTVAATPAMPTDVTTAVAATPTTPIGMSAAATASGVVVTQETAGPTGVSSTTATPGSSTPMILAAPTVRSTDATAAVPTTAVPTAAAAAPATTTGQASNGSARAGGQHGGVGLGRHAGSGFSSRSRGLGGFGGGRSARAPRR